MLAGRIRLSEGQTQT